jgi:hypothetical protein
VIALRRSDHRSSKRDIIRCLKRYAARELLPHIQSAAKSCPDLKLPSIPLDDLQELQVRGRISTSSISETDQR